METDLLISVKRVLKGPADKVIERVVVSQLSGKWGELEVVTPQDPPRDERYRYSISENTGTFWPIDPYDPQKSKDVAEWQFVEVHLKREELWLQKIKDTSFSKALMICGAAHVLSFAFRLRCAGFDVEALYYMPHHKLC